MKSYTDIEQSKKLAEILPVESADMYYMNGTKHVLVIPNYETDFFNLQEDDIPCYSLTALLNVLPSSTLDSSDDHHYRLHCMERFTEWHDNPIDACVEMILKLNEKNLL